MTTRIYETWLYSTFLSTDITLFSSTLLRKKTVEREIKYSINIFELIIKGSIVLLEHCGIKLFFIKQMIRTKPFNVNV